MENKYIELFDVSFQTELQHQLKKFSKMMILFFSAIVMEGLLVALFYSENNHWFFLILTLVVYLSFGWMIMYYLLTHYLPVKKLLRLILNINTKKTKLNQGVISSVEADTLTLRGIACHSVHFLTDGKTRIFYLLEGVTFPNELRNESIILHTIDALIVGCERGEPDA